MIKEYHAALEEYQRYFKDENTSKAKAAFNCLEHLLTFAMLIETEHSLLQDKVVELETKMEWLMKEIQWKGHPLEHMYTDQLNSSGK
jgi:hypothetical protein